MSDMPKRITATFKNWRNPNAGVCYKNDAGDTEYIRKDIADAAVKAERERCAKVALSEGKAMERAARSFMPPRTHADDALYHMHVGGAQTAERIDAAIRKGEQS
jgi:hypothetical protein